MHYPECPRFFHKHHRSAKRCAYKIHNAKNERDREALYRKLIKLSRKTRGYVDKAIEILDRFGEIEAVEILRLKGELKRILPLMKRVISQAERRVLKGEKVPAQEKLVSIFEPHTDIIVKDRRDTIFGHKVCLVGGKSGMILDLIMEKGNPADTDLFPDTLDRQIKLYGRAPRQVSTDAGFASKSNAKYAKKNGVKDVCFSKPVGHFLEKLVKSDWVRKQLLRFRAGIEGNISTLKRVLGLDRCNWSGWESFKCYVWLSVIGYNLRTLAMRLL
jgi:IS5 family transposase